MKNSVYQPSGFVNYPTGFVGFEVKNLCLVFTLWELTSFISCPQEALRLGEEDRVTLAHPFFHSSTR